jgi:hypothetical protein
MASLLKKKYALERVPDICWARDVSVILRLNAAGRQHPVDGSSLSKGVEVLSAVSNEINCVFLHLENPRLCDRNTVEIVLLAAIEINSSRSTSPTASSVGGKREQASVHKSRECVR